MLKCEVVEAGDGAVEATPYDPDHFPADGGRTVMADPQSSTQYEAPYRARYFARYPERKVAEIAVKAAIKNGMLIRPEKCSACDNPSMVIHGHHDDYSKPLEVRWLCPSCHHQADEAREGALLDRSAVELQPRIMAGIAFIECPGCGAEMFAASCWSAWKCWACLRIVTQGAAALP